MVRARIRAGAEAKTLAEPSGFQAGYALPAQALHQLNFEVASGCTFVRETTAPAARKTLARGRTGLSLVDRKAGAEVRGKGKKQWPHLMST